MSNFFGKMKKKNNKATFDAKSFFLAYTHRAIALVNAFIANRWKHSL